MATKKSKKPETENSNPDQTEIPNGFESASSETGVSESMHVSTDAVGNGGESDARGTDSGSESTPESEALERDVPVVSDDSASDVSPVIEGNPPPVDTSPEHSSPPASKETQPQADKPRVDLGKRPRVWRCDELKHVMVDPTTGKPVYKREAERPAYCVECERLGIKPRAEAVPNTGKPAAVAITKPSPEEVRQRIGKVAPMVEGMASIPVAVITEVVRKRRRVDMAKLQSVAVITKENGAVAAVNMTCDRALARSIAELAAYFGADMFGHPLVPASLTALAVMAVVIRGESLTAPEAPNAA